MDNSSNSNIQSMWCNSEVYSTINAAVEHDNDADAWKGMFEDWKNLGREGVYSRVIPYHLYLPYLLYGFDTIVKVY